MLRLAVGALGGLLLFITLVQTSWSIAIIVQPREVLYSEAIVFDKAARLLRGEPLYQSLDRPPYTVAAYTPLYYGLASAAMAVFGPGFGPGRALSFIAGLTTAALVGFIAAHRTRDARAGVFAALVFLALGLSSIEQPWSSMYREQVLGVALSLASLTTLVSGITIRRVVLAAVFAALAILTKQMLVTALVAGTVWLARRERPKAAIFAGTALALAAATCAGLEATTGSFLANAVDANANPFSLSALAVNVAIFILFMGGPTLVAGLHVLDRAWRRRVEFEDELLMTAWLVSLVSIAGLAKVGAAQNYWIENAAITAVLATLSLWFRLSETVSSAKWPRAGVPIALLSVTIGAYSILISLGAVIGSRHVWPNEAEVQALRSVVERVRSEPGDVLAEPLDVVVLAGRPIFFEPYIYSILHREGRWDAEALVHRIRAGEIGLLVLDRHLEDANTSTHGYATWPEPILSALRARMEFEAEVGGRFLYVPRQVSPSAARREKVP